MPATEVDYGLRFTESEPTNFLNSVKKSTPVHRDRVREWERESEWVREYAPPTPRRCHFKIAPTFGPRKGLLQGNKKENNVGYLALAILHTWIPCSIRIGIERAESIHLSSFIGWRLQNQIYLKSKCCHLEENPCFMKNLFISKSIDLMKHFPIWRIQYNIISF